MPNARKSLPVPAKATTAMKAMKAVKTIKARPAAPVAEAPVAEEPDADTPPPVGYAGDEGMVGHADDAHMGEEGPEEEEPEADAHPHVGDGDDEGIGDEVPPGQTDNTRGDTGYSDEYPEDGESEDGSGDAVDPPTNANFTWDARPAQPKPTGKGKGKGKPTGKAAKVKAKAKGGAKASAGRKPTGKAARPKRTKDPSNYEMQRYTYIQLQMASEFIGKPSLPTRPASSHELSELEPTRLRLG